MEVDDDASDENQTDAEDIVENDDDEDRQDDEHPDQNLPLQEGSRSAAIVRRAQKNISVMQLYAYRIQVRINEGMLHYFGRLFHQYVVDMYVKVEHRRLEFLRNNQRSLRTELYSGLTDATITDSTTPTEKI